jgi:hypothetical protein
MSLCTYSTNNTTIFYAVSVTCHDNVVRNRLDSAMWRPTTSDFPPDATPHDTAIICYTNGYLCSKWLLMMGMERPKHVEFLE